MFPASVSDPLVTNIYTRFTTLFARKPLLEHQHNVGGTEIFVPDREEKNEQSWYRPQARSPCHHSRIRKIVSGTSDVSGPVSSVGGRVPSVARAESLALGRVGSSGPHLSYQRRKSRLRNRVVSEFHSSVDGPRAVPRGCLRPRGIGLQKCSSSVRIESVYKSERTPEDAVSVRRAFC